MHKIQFGSDEKRKGERKVAVHFSEITEKITSTNISEINYRQNIQEIKSYSPFTVSTQGKQF